MSSFSFSETGGDQDQTGVKGQKFFYTLIGIRGETREFPALGCERETVPAYTSEFREQQVIKINVCKIVTDN